MDGQESVKGRCPQRRNLRCVIRALDPSRFGRVYMYNVVAVIPKRFKLKYLLMSFKRVISSYISHTYRTLIIETLLNYPCVFLSENRGNSLHFNDLIILNGLFERFEASPTLKIATPFIETLIVCNLKKTTNDNFISLLIKQYFKH